MSTTSVDMQPASAAASASTGDGPAAPFPSIVNDACLVVTENVSSLATPKLGLDLSSGGGPRHTRSTTVAGLDGTLLRHRLLSGGAPVGKERADRQPAERHQHEHVAQILTVAAVRPVRLGRPVKRFAIGEHTRLGQLVESVNEQLNHEHEQEHRRHLKEQPEVHAVAES